MSNGSAVPDPKREMLRHAVATLAYRGGKAIRNAPASLADFRSGEARTPLELVAHIGDLLDWGLSIASGSRTWKDSKPLSWDAEVERFFAALTRFDQYLASSEQLHAPPEKLLQGPIADALTHVGQIAILRRMAGAPIRSESYFDAEIVAGRVGPTQPPPRREF